MSFLKSIKANIAQFSGLTRQPKDPRWPRDGGLGFNNSNYQGYDPYGYYERYAGTSVDYKQKAGKLTSHSLVMAAVNWLGTQLTEARLRVYEMGKEDRPVEVKNHDLYKLMRRPTPSFTGQLLYKAFALSWIIDGNVYWLKVRNRLGEVIQIWPLPHFAVSPLWDDNGTDYISGYAYRVNDVDYFIKVGDMIHFRYNLNPENQRKGLSPLASLYRELYADNERANFAAAMMSNYGIPGVILSPASDMQIFDETSAAKIKAEFKRRFTGDGRGDPLVTSKGVKVDQVGFEPQQMEFSAISRLPEERVAAAIGIPAAVLGYGAGLASVNYAIMKELREQAYEGVVIPTQKLMADEITVQLLSEFEGVSFEDDERWCAFDLSDVRVLQEDEAKKTERIVKAWNAGIIMRAEARAELGVQVDSERDRVFLASAGTALVPEQIADGQSLQPVVSVYDQQRDAGLQRGQQLEPNGSGAAPGQTFPPKQTETPDAPPKYVNGKSG